MSSPPSAPCGKKAGSKRNKVPAKNFQVPVFFRFGAALFSLLGQGRRTRGYFFKQDRQIFKFYGIFSVFIRIFVQNSTPQESPFRTLPRP
jgi:hypothetical protein